MTNQSLYIRALINVIKNHLEKFIANIREEYECLLFQTQKRKASKKTLDLLKIYYEKVNKIEIRGIGHAYKLHALRLSLEESLKTRYYHPSQLKIYQNYLD